MNGTIPQLEELYKYNGVEEIMSLEDVLKYKSITLCSLLNEALGAKGEILATFLLLLTNTNILLGN